MGTVWYGAYRRPGGMLEGFKLRSQAEVNGVCCCVKNYQVAL